MSNEMSDVSNEGVKMSTNRLSPTTVAIAKILQKLLWRCGPALLAGGPQIWRIMIYDRVPEISLRIG